MIPAQVFLVTQAQKRVLKKKTTTKKVNSTQKTQMKNRLEITTI